MKWLTYDLEACFLAKGNKRLNQRILEIGMVRGRKTFQRLVNPIGGGPVLDTLQDLGQHPEKTVHFWTKLLCEKKYMNTSMRRKSIDRKAAAIRLLLDTCPDFVTEEEAVRDARAFGKGALWIAHNGRSFDHRIMHGQFQRLAIRPPPFGDSLPVLRRKLDLPSYSQPAVYKALFRGKYLAHHALEDAKALKRILCKLSDDVPSLFDACDLQLLRGIGPRSERVLRDQGIDSIHSLRCWVLRHGLDDWNKTMRIYNYRSFGKHLFQYGVNHFL